MYESEATSVEHVPPRCLFPEIKDLPEGHDLRKSLITVPSCDKHNTIKSTDDEYFLYCLVLSLPSNVVANNQFLKKIHRATKRNPSLAGKLMEKASYLYLLNEEDKTLSKQVGIKIDLNRINNCLDHLSRGIYFHHFKEKWTKILDITPYFLFSTLPEDYENNKLKNEIDKLYEAKFREYDKNGSNPDVFYYKMAAEGKSKYLRLYFYGGNTVTVVFQ